MNSIAKVEPFDMVVFGATGDLSTRKLIPALYFRYLEGQLPDDCRIIGASRQELSRQEFVQLISLSSQGFLAEHYQPDTWARFVSLLDYCQIDFSQVSDFTRLQDYFTDVDPDRVRTFYLATQPSLFGTLCQNLAGSGLTTNQSRVVLEKPLGHDSTSSKQINDVVGDVFGENQIYRIDHYLGKETVQNLLALRFANSLFEPLWCNKHIDYVQITVAETVGVGSRGEFYNQAGALRDMVQNHLLQLLCIIAMEPPVDLEADSVRDEKLKVLRSLRPITPELVNSVCVRGQYRSGAVDGGPVISFLHEDGIPADSTTETFVGIKAHIDNWRWSGVPFFMRTGKRLHNKVSEIVLHLRSVPHDIFPDTSGELVDNQLIIRLQPDEGVKLKMMAKKPGPGMKLMPVNLHLDFAETFKGRLPDAYERLLIDVIKGRPMLFMRRDELEAAWRWIDPILETWQTGHDRPQPYTSGTWGPSAAIALIERDGYTWHEEFD